MSGILGRMSTIVKAKMSRALDRAEDPTETLDFSYEKQLQLLQNVRRGLADVATARARLQLQQDKLAQDIEKLDGQARQALGLNREDLARVALQRKADLTTQSSALATQVQDLQREQQKLADGESRLTAKIEAFRTQKETIKAQYTAAQAQVKIGEAASGLSEEMGDVGLAVQRAQDKTLQMQARASAVEELTAAGNLPDLLSPGQTNLDRQLAQLSVSSVDLELERMKQQLSGGAPVQELPAHVSPLQLEEGHNQPRGEEAPQTRQLDLGGQS